MMTEGSEKAKQITEHQLPITNESFCTIANERNLCSRVNNPCQAKDF